MDIDENLKDYFDKQFVSLKRELLEQQEAQNESLTKKLKKEYNFKYTGNEKQFKFNTEIREGFTSVKARIEKGELDKALEVIEQGIADIDYRNKPGESTD